MPAGEKQISFGKIVWAFLIAGPPTFAPIFYVVGVVVDSPAGTLFTKLGEVLRIAFSLYGLLMSYAAGFFPALVAGFAYSFVDSASRRHNKTASYRFLRAALVGAVVYSLICVLALLTAYGGRVETVAWLYTVYAACAGAVSACLCALVVEIYLAPSSEK
jgi:uncharacterized membrane protein YeaQ/YmgE (transglycosylase-associated protein family)